MAEGMGDENGYTTALKTVDWPGEKIRKRVA